MKKNISSLGEFGLIRRLTAQLHLKKKVALIGPGDDCAVIRERGSHSLSLLTTDLLVEGVHFRRDWMTLQEIGFKAMRINLSDIAAMGGRPRYALISVGLPKDFSVKDSEELFRGLAKAGQESGVAIVGGDTNRSRELILNVALLGDSQDGRILTRAGAKPGDAIYVTGTLGEAALGLRLFKMISIRKNQVLLRRHIVPPNRLSVGYRLARMNGVHSMIDLSDGLIGDLRHILESSHVGAEVTIKTLPVSRKLKRESERLGLDPLQLAMSGGEDYELLFTAAQRVKVPKNIDGVSITKIGKIVPHKAGLRILQENGRSIPWKGGGFQHF